jgi:hypothetical protein
MENASEVSMEQYAGEASGWHRRRRRNLREQRARRKQGLDMRD